MRVDKKLVKPTINGVFGSYFNPSGHGNCFLLLPNDLEFAVFVVGDDVVCDFGNIGWRSISPHQHLFIPAEEQLRGHNLIRGEVILRYRAIRDAKISHRER